MLLRKSKKRIDNVGEEGITSLNVVFNKEVSLEQNLEKSKKAIYMHEIIRVFQAKRAANVKTPRQKCVFSGQKEQERQCVVRASGHTEV